MSCLSVLQSNLSTICTCKVCPVNKQPLQLTVRAAKLQVSGQFTVSTTAAGSVYFMDTIHVTKPTCLDAVGVLLLHLHILDIIAMALLVLMTAAQETKRFRTLVILIQISRASACSNSGTNCRKANRPAFFRCTRSALARS